MLAEALLVLLLQVAFRYSERWGRSWVPRAA